MKESRTKTTAIVEGVLTVSLKHKFSVSVDGVHATKRECQMFGPIMHCTDPNKLLPNLFLFMPMWEINTKKSKNHRTISLRSSKVEDVQEIKMKTKNIKVYAVWLKQMQDAKDNLSNIKIRFANHSIRLNKDGSFVPAKFQMSNDSAKILLNDKVVIDTPRYPESWASPNLNDYEKVHLYRGDHMVATVKCKSPLQALKLIIEMNVVPEDLESIVKIDLEETPVPEINEAELENMSGSSSFASTSNLMLEAMLEGGDEEEEEEEEAADIANELEEEDEEDRKSLSSPRKSKLKRLQKKAAPIQKKEEPKKKKRRGNTMAVGFKARMEEKMEKLKELPRNEKRPDPNELINGIISNFKLNVKLGSSPIINIPESEIAFVNAFEYPPEPFFTSLYPQQVQVYQFEEKTINSDYNNENIFNALPKDIQEKLKAAGVKISAKPVNDFKNIFDKIESISADDLPAFATGVFLNGRAMQYPAMAQNLLGLHFSNLRIRDILRDLRIVNKKGFYEFFYQLYHENLAPTFFNALGNFVGFRINCYFPDAFMRDNSTCEILAKSAKKATKKVKSPTIPHKLTTSPHIILENVIPLFKQNETEAWINVPNQRGPTPFSMIVASVIALIAKTYSDSDGKAILYHGSYGILWRRFYVSRDKLGKDFEKYFHITRKAHRDEKVVEIIIRAIVENRIVDFLINYMTSEKLSTAAHQNEFVLCISELLKLNPLFSPYCLNTNEIFAHTVKDLEKVFIRDPVKNVVREEPENEKSLMGMIVNEAVAKANEAKVVVTDATTKMADQVAKNIK